MRAWLAGVASVAIAFACAPTIAPAPPPTCTETRIVNGRPLALNVMLVVDRSAGAPDLTELTQALQVVLTHQPTFARYGLAVFPHDDACGAGDATDVLLHLPDAGSLDLDVDLQAQSDQAVFQLGAITARGQPAMGDALRFIGALPELHDPHRGSIIVVLARRLPDCGPDGGLGNAIAAIEQLRQAGLQTLVIPFDTDLTDAGTVTGFDLLANAGAFARTCFQGLDLECAPPMLPDAGADAGSTASCDTATHLCEPQFVPVTNSTELEAAITVPLTPIAADLVVDDTCSPALTHKPASPGDVFVSVDGQPLPECDGGGVCDTWQLDAGSGVAKVIFEGIACQKLLGASVNNPSMISIQIAHCSD